MKQWTAGQWKKYVTLADMTREGTEYKSDSESTEGEDTAERGPIDDGFVHPVHLERSPFIDSRPRLMRAHAKLEGQMLATLRRASLARTIEELWRAGPFSTATLPYLFPQYDDEAATRTVDLLTWFNCVYQKRTGQLSKPPELHPARRPGDRRARGMEIEESFEFEVCCACADVFAYDLERCDPEDIWRNSSFVYIWPGVPPRIEYTAVSYVWGNAVDIAVRCHACRYVTVFPIDSVSKFHQIMQLAGRNSFVWLDALSIDQGDHGSIAEQVSVMGEVYNNASRVTVLLPTGDFEGYETLSSLSTTAKDLLRRASQFVMNKSDVEEALGTEAEGTLEEFERNKTFTGDSRQIYTSFPSAPSTSNLCSRLFDDLNKLNDLISSLKYWERAWTFQEWSLAKDIDIGIESKTQSRKITSVKPSIFSAASVVCQHLLLRRRSSHLEYRLSERAVVAYFNVAKRLFPIESCLLGHDEIDLRELEMQPENPDVGCDQLLGLRLDSTRKAASAKFRLELMLDTFSQGERKAKFDADLVACWASMCNIPYDYDRDDSLSQAVEKVKRGIQGIACAIVDFIPAWTDTRPGMSNFRPSFFTFAKLHRMHNSTESLEFRGMPFLLDGRTLWCICRRCWDRI